jgi:transcriptional regulator with XRE-family HTH domain
MPLSDAVRRLRLERAWSKRELARQAEVSYMTVWKVESNDAEYEPSLRTLARLAKALGVRPTALMSTAELEQLGQKKVEARAA